MQRAIQFPIYDHNHKWRLWVSIIEDHILNALQVGSHLACDICCQYYIFNYRLIKYWSLGIYDKCLTLGFAIRDTDGHFSILGSSFFFLPKHKNNYITLTYLFFKNTINLKQIVLKKKHENRKHLKVGSPLTKTRNMELMGR